MNTNFLEEWNNKETISLEPNIPAKVYHHVDFGELIVTLEAESFDYTLRDSENHYIFQSILREHYLNGKKAILCSNDEKLALIAYSSIKMSVLSSSDLKNLFPNNLKDKLNRILLNLSKISPDYGRRFTTLNNYDFFAKDNEEIHFLINILKEKNLIDHEINLTSNQSFHIVNEILIKEAGWIEIEKLENPNVSTQAFVAMWFDETMNAAFIEIEKACRSNGYSALKIDLKEHNNEISSEILYEIRKSKFLIADVTGHRQGVYFEAGYSLGLGLKIIWCCRESDFDKVHFDTRQYNHIVWKNEMELFEKLEKRIRSTI
ncbi:hypothetical protein ND856_18985 [Leptospira bandrabouensis]|uniref:hypothetical protein n=1 Tax=Leptospira bandrabouensis TaxID=2484903 RepID=UPI00223CF7AC|nr:hypothetical protein [Leptospira bandrabouensis]MCW7460417.1 hypothetical protein [Leptospira bandrabouensis]MCW7479393.1 hypothetical protein [Leptospira bandrabouensis]MCW7487075.1 hypothetical protein [Leptospira bandrabouensis]